MLKSKWGAPNTTLDRPVTDIALADTVIVLDAANLAARAHHAYSDLRNAAGEYTGHVFGVLKMAESAFNTFKGGRTAIVVALEGLPLHRFSSMPGYKSNRRVDHTNAAELPYDPRGDQMLALSMLPTVLAMAPSGEADDVAASLVLHRRRPGQRVFVVSTDKDLWQLYGAPMTKIIGLKNKALTGDDIRAKFGLSTASMIPAWKALLGDTSDCVPRVPRLLAADAVVWLNQLSLERRWAGVDSLFDRHNLGMLDRRQAELVMRYEYQIRTAYSVCHLDGRATVKCLPSGSADKLSRLIDQFQMVSLRHLLSEWYSAA